MSKEMNVIDLSATEQTGTQPALEFVKLDDLSLALIGGGQGAVCL